MTTQSAHAKLLGSIDVMTEALDVRDSYTRCHCDRVVCLSTALGDFCEVAEADLELLRLCARFHDIGKIGIPDAILLKPGRLNDEEMTRMREHSELGERIFLATGLTIATKVGEIIRHHHEGFDGTGYPDALQGEEIPLLSRILLVTDSYDAMTSTRPYRRALTHKQAMKVLVSESGKKLDPGILASFEAVIESSPARAR